MLAPDLPFDDPGAGYAERVRPALLALDGAADPVIVVGHSRGSARPPWSPPSAGPRCWRILVRGSGVSPLSSRSRPTSSTKASRSRRGSRTADRSAGARRSARDHVSAPVAGGRAEPHPEPTRPGAEGAGEYPLAAHPDVPTALVYGSEDELFTPEWEEFIARDVLGVEPIVIPTGHFPMAEDPQLVADLLERLGSGAVG